MAGNIQIPQDLVKMEFNTDVLRKTITDMTIRLKELEDRVNKLEQIVADL